MRKLHIGLAVLALSFAVHQAANADLSDGLVAYYPLNGNANDASGNGLNGVLYNASFADGYYGLGLQTTGAIDSYLEVPPNALLSPTNAVSISLWFDATSFSTWHSCLVYKAGAQPTSIGFSDRSYTLWAMQNGGIHITSTPSGAASQTTINSPAGGFQANQFTNVIGIVDSSAQSMKVYINGGLAASTPYVGSSILAGDFPLRLGGPFFTFEDQSGLHGVIDDVRIYNRALTTNEIVSLAQLTVPSGQILTNGSFEGSGFVNTEPARPGYMNLPAGSTLIPGWTVTTGVDWQTTWVAPSDGQKSIDLNGSSPGAIQQTFTTVPGKPYSVQFALAGNAFDASPSIKVGQISAGGKTRQFQFDITGHTTTDPGWVNESFAFVANSTSTTLMFQGLSGGAGGCVIDNVRVTTSLAQLTVPSRQLPNGPVSVRNDPIKLLSPNLSTGDVNFAFPIRSNDHQATLNTEAGTGLSWVGNHYDEFHDGSYCLDFDTEGRGEIVAAKAGTVVQVRNTPRGSPDYGPEVTIYHGDGYFSHYREFTLDPDLASLVGTHVEQGQRLGTLSGIVDELLHFQIKYNGNAAGLSDDYITDHPELFVGTGRSVTTGPIGDALLGLTTGGVAFIPTPSVAQAFVLDHPETGNPTYIVGVLGPSVALSTKIGVGDFASLPGFITSDTGTVDTTGGSLALHTGSPVWAAALVPVSESVGSVTFDVDFTSPAGAEGLLSVYWDGGLVGTIDERYADPGVVSYTFDLGSEYAPDLYTLSFRLDPFTEIQSVALINNISVGAVPEPSSVALLAIGTLVLLRRSSGRTSR